MAIVQRESFELELDSPTSTTGGIQRGMVRRLLDTALFSVIYRVQSGRHNLVAGVWRALGSHSFSLQTDEEKRIFIEREGLGERLRRPTQPLKG